MNDPHSDLGPARLSLTVFGIYLLALALVLMTVPNALFAVFGIGGTEEPWIRVAGMLAGFLGFYYVRYSPRAERFFFEMTVQARMTVWLFFLAFVLFAGAPWQLMLFGAVDLCAAGWTWWALSATARRAPAGA